MSIALRHLEGFYWTGLAGGYAAAAEAMPYPITAPAIYQQVRKLERALGTPLVSQVGPRKTVLTPDGRALHEFVAPFFVGLPGIVDGIRRGQGSRLVLAVHGALAREVVAPAVALLRRSRPALRVRLAE